MQHPLPEHVRRSHSRVERGLLVASILLLTWSLYLGVSSELPVARVAPSVLLPLVMALLSGASLLGDDHPPLSRALRFGAWIFLAVTLSIQFGLLRV